MNEPKNKICANCHYLKEDRNDILICLFTGLMTREYDSCFNWRLNDSLSEKEQKILDDTLKKLYSK